MGKYEIYQHIIGSHRYGKSKQFYHDVLGLDIVADFGANVTLTGGVVLQTMDTWKSFIRTDKVILPNNAGELYFEEDNIDAFCNHLKPLKSAMFMNCLNIVGG